ncbi:MAG TPA: YceD family protein, partial [Actinomycetota bacterium]|nr:YceD family protein [Actinomycetota bacterium]
PFHTDLDELFVSHPDEDSDAYPLTPEWQIEPEQMIRDVIGVEMPFSPLCRSDCQGLCATCGGNRNLGECPGHAEFDQRFAVLADLFPDLPNLD